MRSAILSVAIAISTYKVDYIDIKFALFYIIFLAMFLYMDVSDFLSGRKER